ncbi:MAG: Lon protease family protein [Isosphaeraceae bacterium]
MNNPTDPRELKPSDLAPVLDAQQLGFCTTAELEPLDEVIGQERALRAMEIGLSLPQRGYNVFATGISGTNPMELIKRLLEERAGREPTPDDWVYVHNFDEPDCPVALRLPAGHGARLRAAASQILEHLRHDLPEALKAKDFSAERDRLGTAFGKRSEVLYNELLEEAKRLDLQVQRQQGGTINIIPLKDGKPMGPQDFEGLSESEKADLERRQEAMGEHITRIMAQQQALMREMHSSVEEIVHAFARRIIDPLLAQAKLDFPSEPLAKWLVHVRDHLLANLGQLQEEKQQGSDPAALAQRQDPWRACDVNVVVDHGRTKGAPLLVELSPNYKNLFGAIEHDVNPFGRITTDFTRIKSGSLLRASGGYLVLDLDDALTEPFVWKQLKRALRSGQLLTEAYDPMALFTAPALRPQPIPINTKLIVRGSSQLYYLLQAADADFNELFKIQAEFGDEAPRDAESQRGYARFIAKLVKEEALLPYSADGVGEIIRFGARAAEHRDKLSVQFGAVADLVREAAYWARSSNGTAVGATHVRRALEERVYRSDRIIAKIRALIKEGALRVALEGRRTGQINGLPVIELGDVRFGWPSRITASVGVGKEGVVNIEREVEMSGHIHDKGMLILEGYLRQRYARQHPLALSASLVFEQSYGWIEGDSAAVAELCCLLSALADVPMRQDVAVTGSVNQHGEVQVVGAINDKIEGFYDTCKLKGLTGTQGVCIPRGNVSHLVLRHDVISAVAEGKFHIWAIDTIDEGIELLMGMPAGDLDVQGTFHHRLDQRQQEILALLQEQPTTTSTTRPRFTVPGGPPQPAPPPLPGQAT